MLPSHIPALCLMGPTASGKTALALALHDLVARGGTPWTGAEIVSVDSAQVFRGMDIGTAKPDAATRARVPHHLLDILDPAESYSVARFCDDARTAVAAIRARGALPLLVGGTGLYFRALEQGLSAPPPADATIRERLMREGAQQGWPALHARLHACDPAAAAMIQPQDQQRIVRALEIWEATGQTRSAHWAAPRQGGLPGPVVKVALAPPDRAVLHATIAERFHAMMQAGFLAEVQALMARGDLHADLPAVRAVGYRQLWEHLQGQGSLSAAVERGIIATRQYAKRQFTWLRSETNAHWLDPRAPDALGCIVKKLTAASSFS